MIFVWSRVLTFCFRKWKKVENFKKLRIFRFYLNDFFFHLKPIGMMLAKNLNKKISIFSDHSLQRK